MVKAAHERFWKTKNWLFKIFAKIVGKTRSIHCCGAFDCIMRPPSGDEGCPVVKE